LGWSSICLCEKKATKYRNSCPHLLTRLAPDNIIQAFKPTA